MPGDSEQPVTLEALYVVQSFNDIRSATVADLVLALRAEGVLVVESSVRHNWPAWAIDVLRYDVAALAERGAVAILDALAEAQPFPPAGGVS